ncbi:MAG: carboxylate--amine ligase [Natronomonas sp.]
MASTFHSFEDLCGVLENRSYDRPPAIVCNAHITGLGVARSLDAQGVPVIALDRTPDGVAPYSDAVDVAGAIRYPLDDEDGFRDDMETLVDHLGADPVAFPCMDEWALALARSTPDGVRLPFAEFETVDGVLDKSALYRRAIDVGVSIPETYWLEETDPEVAAEELGFPLVVKPALKRRFEEQFGTNLVVAETPEEYHSVLTEASRADLSLLAQEFVPKEQGDLYTLTSYVPADGTERAITMVGNRLAVYPPSVGTTCLVETADVPAVETNGLEILEASGYHGISEAEFLYDDRREEYLLIDVNTRPWKWIDLPIQAGADLPAVAYADTIGESFDANPEITDKRWVYLRDYLALLSAHPVPDRLDEDDWRAIVTGDVENHDELTTAVYRPSDPGPTMRLIETEFSDREYYCAC